MALDDSALPELLAALRAGDGVDLIRDAVRLVMQDLRMADKNCVFAHAAMRWPLTGR